MPIGFGVMLVSMGLPDGGLSFESRFVGNAAIQTLVAQDGDFRVGHVEPASVFGRVVQLETLGEAASFFKPESRMERGRRMRTQIVLNQHDVLGVGEMHVGQFVEHMRVVDGGVMEAKPIALACSPAPEGFARWSLRLLEERKVEL